MRSTTSDRLKELMERRGLRQADILRLCEPYCDLYHLHMGKSDLSQYVSGKVAPGQWKLSILGHALNVSEAWLMGYDVPEQRDPDLSADEVRQLIESHEPDPVVSTAPCDPEQMDYADKEDETIRIMTRVMQRMSPENRQKLLDVARVMFSEDFDDEDYKKTERSTTCKKQRS